MYEAIKNQVIDTVKETQLKGLRNNHTRFLSVTCCDRLDNLINHITWCYQPKDERSNRLFNADWQVLQTCWQLHPIYRWWYNNVYGGTSATESTSGGPGIRNLFGCLQWMGVNLCFKKRGLFSLKYLLTNTTISSSPRIWVQIRRYITAWTIWSWWEI